MAFVSKASDEYCYWCNTTETAIKSAPLVPQSLTYDEIILGLKPALHFFNLYGYVVWYLIGIPANVTAFLVWIQEKMLNSSGCYMAALALTDIIFLLVHLLMSIGHWSEDMNLFNYHVACQLLPLIYTAAQYMSALLVLEFTAEQYIAICHPFKRNIYCRISIAKKAILVVALIVLTLSSPQAYFFHRVEIGNGTYVCTVRASLLEGGTAGFWFIWTWVIEMILFGAVPLSCLCLNIKVIYELTHQRKLGLAKHYSATSNTSECLKRNKRHGTTTAMLLVVSLYWVCTELPATITLGLKQVFEVPKVSSIDEARVDPKTDSFLNYVTARYIVELLCFSRYSCKLFLYLVTGRQFRKYLLKTCLCIKKTLRTKLMRPHHNLITSQAERYNTSTRQTILEDGFTKNRNADQLLTDRTLN